MQYVHWKYIDKHADHFDCVHQSFTACGLDKFVNDVKSPWCEELIMQFYATVHFYPDGSLKWMTDGVRYECIVEEWANLLGLPPDDDDLLDVYRQDHMRHEAMEGMYKQDLTEKEKESFKLRSIYYPARASYYQ